MLLRSERDALGGHRIDVAAIVYIDVVEPRDGRARFDARVDPARQRASIHDGMPRFEAPGAFILSGRNAEPDQPGQVRRAIVTQRGEESGDVERRREEFAPGCRIGECPRFAFDGRDAPGTRPRHARAIRGQRDAKGDAAGLGLAADLRPLAGPCARLIAIEQARFRMLDGMHLQDGLVHVLEHVAQARAVEPRRKRG